MFDYIGRLSYRGYTKSVENIWKVSVWVEYVLVFINGMYAHQKLFIFKNGIITYHKYRKENFGIKEDLGIVIEKSNRVQVKFKGKALFVCMALVIDSLCIFLCYIVNKTFNIEPVKCQTAHCGRCKPRFVLGEFTSPIVPYRNLPQTPGGMTADCRSLV